ncbi:cell division cycle protein 123 homolog isoform X1 [Amborella trichopoda]|nr:cell division cycle protein 123 homolog isoform X1 [Amborella trichopoda]|eukprot:XP_011624343.2 cell division cycle protein 123 homolog isoform X1 [Amborella trichopoda]
MRNFQFTNSIYKTCYQTVLRERERGEELSHLGPYQCSIILRLFSGNFSWQIRPSIRFRLKFKGLLLKMKEEELWKCQIQDWYPKFKAVSIKTLFHKLPEPFVEYLMDDSGPFVLPKTISNQDALPHRLKPTCPELQGEDYHPWEEEKEENEDEEDTPSFPELELTVNQSIEILGRSVFPKLNWSAPKDTAWISPNGTLRCTCFSEIALLLRSSDSLVHDLCHAFDSCEDKSCSRPPQFYLALRKWYGGLRPEMEFRCFVRGGLLVGISQREITGFYPSVFEEQPNLESLVFEFFEEHVVEKFELENYTFDVYVTKDRRAKLIDFNPWGAFTLPLLFSWEELEKNFDELVKTNDALDADEEGTSETFERVSIEGCSKNVRISAGSKMLRLRERGYHVDFRVVVSEGAVQPGLRAMSGVPYDYIDAAPGSAWDQFLKNADEELQRQGLELD